MDYSLLTEQQLQKRYYFLPEKLKDVLDSENNLESIRQICRAHHLNDDEKIMIVEQLVGLILLGFLSPDDLNSEISGNLYLNKKHSDDIVSEIDRKIFTPIRSDLEKVYAPAEALAREGVPPLPEIEKKSEALDLRAAAIETEPAEAPKIIPQEEKKPEEVKKEEIQPTKVSPATGLPSDLSAEAQAKAEALAKEGPLIIHKEAEFKPLSETKKSLGGLFGFLRKGKEKEEKISPVKAEVEIGELKEESEEGKVKSEERKELLKEPPKVRVVHYTEFPTPVSPFGTIEESEKRKEGERKEEGKIEIKPPENLPIKIEPEVGLIKETKKEEVQLLSIEADKRGFMQTVEAEERGKKEEIQIPKVEEKIQPLDLRKPPAAEAALSGKPEESKPTKPPVVSPVEPEEEEIIDLSSFK